VIVVGCGPAGATAARVAADCGRAVLIIDRKRSVGQPPRCAGFVPSWLPERAGVDSGSVLQPITHFRFQDGSQSAEVEVDGAVIDRTRFDKTLAILALEAGADLCNGFVIRREDRILIARRNGAEASFSGGAIVCADGAASVVSRSVDPSRRRYLATMQFEVGLERTTETVSLRRPVFERRGLGWFIPSGRTAKIGVALPRSMSRVLKPALLSVIREFERDGAIFKNAVLGATGGLVPIDRRPVSDLGLSMLVAGDARGGLGVDGAGIANAVLSGELAGLTAHRFLDRSSDDVIEKYDLELDQLLSCGSGETRSQNPSAFKKWVSRTQRFLAWSPDPIDFKVAT
jgi:digeranylgeranylglycerophospholipid reductase